MALIKTTIDGKEIEVERDRWALDVIGEMGISIPTLCYHSAMEPYGACRLCVVEVTKGKWSWITTACDLPIREGLSIRTDTDAVKESRKITIELIWARAPQAEGLAEMAKELGVEKSRFEEKSEAGKCILCGLCVRVCENLIGVSAISFVNRGHNRRVDTPFGEESKTCIGCNACVAVCPTGHIVSVDKGNVRAIETWNTELEMVGCDGCGKGYMPVKMYDEVKAKLDGKIELEKVCAECMRSKTAGKLSSVTSSKQ